jgi:hypothetical protein
MIDRTERTRDFTWRRHGPDWLLFERRRKFGRVVPDTQHPGMWRCVLANGRLSDLSNLSRAKSATLDAATREIEWEAGQTAAA